MNRKVQQKDNKKNVIYKHHHVSINLVMQLIFIYLIYEYIIYLFINE